MTTIIATIKKQYLDYIRFGAKKFEIRKTLPKCGVPFKVLCCESGSNGIIRAEFICDYVEHRYTCDSPCEVYDACVGLADAEKYSGGHRVYFWHISNMIDYEYGPKHISEFGLKRAPQSWQYVKEVP